MARKVEIQIVGDARSAVRAFNATGRAGRNFQVGIGTIAKSAVVFEGVRRAMDGVASAVRTGASEWSDQVKATAQTNAALRSTRGIANVTRSSLDRLARSIQRMAGFDDEAVKASGNLLLTFKAVRNEAGRGNRVFDRAIRSAADLATRGFGDLSTNAIRLGKALSDPVRGVTALRRAGVDFTQAQRDQIKALVESGKLLEAQKIILREVESQVGGSARAFGQTLPGQLARLRESVKNTFGDLVALVVPSLTGALDAVNRFVDDLSAQRTIRGKLNVVWEGVRGAAQGATEAIGRAVQRIDWAAVWSQARGIADGLQERLEEVDWGVIGKEIGDAFADAVRVAVPAAKELAERVSDAVSAIDFEDLGKKLGPGLAAALVTAFTTLLDPAFWVRNWDLSLAVAATIFRARVALFAGKLLAPLARAGGSIVLGIAGGIERLAPRLASVFLSALTALPRIAARALSPLTKFVISSFARLGRIARFVVTVLGIQAAINAVVGFAKRVGEVFRNLGRTIASALDRAWEAIRRGAIRAALAILEPFSRLPRRFGQWARDAKEALQRQLDEMGASAEATATRIQRAINSVQGKTVTVTVITKIKRVIEGATGALRGSAVGAADSAATAGDNSVAQAAVEQANRQARAEEAAAAAVAAAKAKAAQAAKRAAAAAKRALEQQKEAFATLLDNLGLAADKAAATKGFRDDLRVARATLSAINAQIKIGGETAELLRQQFEAEQRVADIRKQIAENRRAAQQARQFRALGLSETGGERVPSAGTLGKRLGALKDQVKGTFLDTQKTRTQLQQIGKVLAGAFGKVGADVRLAIKQMLDDIASALKGDGAQAGPLTKFAKGGVGKFLENVSGLTAEQIRQLRSNFAQIGPGGSVPNKGVGAFGFAFPVTAGAGAGAGIGAAEIVVHSHLHLDGRVVAESTTRHQQRQRGRHAASSRGTRAGAGR